MSNHSSPSLEVAQTEPDRISNDDDSLLLATQGTTASRDTGRTVLDLLPVEIIRKLGDSADTYIVARNLETLGEKVRTGLWSRYGGDGTVIDLSRARMFNELVSQTKYQLSQPRKRVIASVSVDEQRAIWGMTLDLRRVDLDPYPDYQTLTEAERRMEKGYIHPSSAPSTFSLGTLSPPPLQYAKVEEETRDQVGNTTVTASITFTKMSLLSVCEAIGRPRKSIRRTYWCGHARSGP
jgi:hypothetical protein